MEQRSELKSARLLEIYTRLEQGRTLKKRIWRRNFTSRSGAFSVTWRTCAVFSPSATWSGRSSTTASSGATAWCPATREG